MLQIENAIFILLILSFAICVLFWLQISQVSLPEDAPMLFSMDLLSGLDTKLLFRAHLDFASDLDQSKLTIRMQREFTTNGIDLSDRAIVLTEDIGILWRITDSVQVSKNQLGEFGGDDTEPQVSIEKKTYLISKQNGHLAVYDSNKVSSTLRQGFNKNQKPLAQDATIATITPGSRWLVTDSQTRKQYELKKELDKKGVGKLNVYAAADLDTIPSILSLIPPLTVDLPDRDIFELPRPKGSIVGPVITELPEPPPVLSTIFWTDANSLAVIGGQILGLDQQDKDKKFRVEEITPKSVVIRRETTGEIIMLTLKESQPQ